MNNNPANKNLKYKLVALNGLKNLKTLNTLNPINDRQKPKPVDKNLKDREEGFSIYIMGANEERMKNKRKKEQIEQNKMRSNNNSCSVANRKKWDDKFDKWNDNKTNSGPKKQNKLSIEKSGDAWENPSNKKKNTLNNEKSSCFSYKLMSKLILENSRPISSTILNNVKKESKSSIHDILMNINKINYKVANVTNKMNQLDGTSPIESPFGMSSSNNKRCRNGWGEPKYNNNLGIVYPEYSSSLEPVLDRSKNVKIDMTDDKIKINKNLKPNVNIKKKTNHIEELENLDEYLDNDNIGQLDTLGSRSNDLNFSDNTPNNRSTCSNKFHNVTDMKNSTTSINFVKEVLSPQKSLIGIGERDNINLQNSTSGAGIGGLLKEGKRFHYNYEDRRSLTNNHPNIENSRDILNKYADNSEYSNVSNVDEDRNTNGIPPTGNILKSNSSLLKIHKTKSTSPNQKIKSAYTKNRTKSLNKKNLNVGDRPLSSLMSISKISKLKSINTNNINMNNDQLKNVGKNIISETSLYNNNSNNQIGATAGNIPSIQFIYKSPQNKLKKNRNIKKKTSEGTGINNFNYGNTQYLNLNMKKQNTSYKGSNILGDRFSSREHAPSFGNEMEISSNTQSNFSKIKKNLNNYPMISNIQQIRTGVTKQSVSSSHSKKKFDILSKIDKLDDTKLSKLAKVVEELTNHEVEVSQEYMRINSNNNSTKEVDNIFFNNFKDKFNVNYIKADSVNFGNININCAKNDGENNIDNNDQLISSPSFKTIDRSKKNSFSGSMALNPFKMKRSINSYAISNYSVISIVILSTWGNNEKLGLTEVQIFDRKNKKIEIIECHVFNGQEEGVSKIYNNKFHTIDDNDMWVTSISNIQTNKVKIEIYFDANYSVGTLLIWNYNGRDITKGIKDIEIYKKNNFTRKALVNKGCYNLKSNYSTMITLDIMSPTNKSPISHENYTISNLELNNILSDSIEYELGKISPCRTKSFNAGNLSLNANKMNNIGNVNNDTKLLREDLVSQDEENRLSSIAIRVNTKTNSLNSLSIKNKNNKEDDFKIITNLNSARNTVNNSFVSKEMNSVNNPPHEYEKNVMRTSIGNNHVSSNINNLLSSVSSTTTKQVLISNNFSSNSITCLKIRLVIINNYGDASYVGLTGVQFLDEYEDVINIENAKSIGAMPKDINTVFENCGDPRIFENIFSNINETTEEHNMWLTPYHTSNPPYIEIVFAEIVTISAIRIWNYNGNLLERGVKSLNLILDDDLNTQKTIVLHKGIGEDSVDYSQTILFPILSFNFTEEELEPFKNIKPASMFYSQDYETPYLPTGFIFTVMFLSTWGDEEYVGLNGLEFYDQLGNAVLSYNIPRIVSKPLANEDVNNLISLDKNYFLMPFINISSVDDDDLFYDENNFNKNNLESTFSNLKNKNSKKNYQKNNRVYFIFDRPVSLSYINFWNISKHPERGAKDIHITCDNNIIYKGYLRKFKRTYNITSSNSNYQSYNNGSTVIMFTSDTNIVNQVNESHIAEPNVKNKYKYIENLNSSQNSSYIMQIDTDDYNVENLQRGMSERSLEK